MRRIAPRALALAMAAAVAAAAMAGILLSPGEAHAQSVSQNPTTPVAGKVYKITPGNAQTCVAAAVPGNRDDLSNVGRNVQLASFSGRRSQLVKVTAANGGGYRLQPVGALDAGGCLTAEGFGRSQNVSVEAWSGKATQKWKFAANGDGTVTVTAATNSGYALDLAQSGTAAGTNVQLHTNNGSGAQRFLFYEVSSGALLGSADDNSGNSGLYINTAASSGPTFTSAPTAPKYVGSVTGTPLGNKSGWFVGVDNGGSVTATYSNVGTYNGEPVSVQVRIHSCTKPAADLAWQDVIAWTRANCGGRTSHVVFPNRFSGEFSMFNLATMSFEFRFYKTAGGSPSYPINVGTSYFSATDLDQMEPTQEWAASLTPTSAAYVEQGSTIMSGPISWNGGSVADAYYGTGSWLGSDDHGEGTVTFKYSNQSVIGVRVGSTNCEMGFNLVFKAPYAVPVPATVDYYCDGAKVWSTTVAANTTVTTESAIMATARALAAKPGCSFEGWFADAACTSRFGSSYLQSGSKLTLYGYNSATVSYYSDGALVHSEQARYGTTLAPSAAARSKAEKADCSGFDGWYADASCSRPYSPATVTGATSLYGRNAVRIDYDLTDRAKSYFDGKTAFADRAMTRPADPLADVPPAYEGWYGDAVTFASPSLSPVYVEDGAVRTLTASEGVYAVRDPGRGDVAMLRAKATQSRTVYIGWSLSTYDGFEAR